MNTLLVYEKTLYPVLTFTFVTYVQYTYNQHRTVTCSVIPDAVLYLAIQGQHMTFTRDSQTFTKHVFT